MPSTNNVFVVSNRPARSRSAPTRRRKRVRRKRWKELSSLSKRKTLESIYHRISKLTLSWLWTFWWNGWTDAINARRCLNGPQKNHWSSCPNVRKKILLPDRVRNIGRRWRRLSLIVPFASGRSLIKVLHDTMIFCNHVRSWSTRLASFTTKMRNWRTCWTSISASTTNSSYHLPSSWKKRDDHHHISYINNYKDKIYYII